jgi:hypothetical protein
LPGQQKRQAVNAWRLKKKRFFAKYNGHPILAEFFLQKTGSKVGITHFTNSSTRNPSKPCNLMIDLPTVKGEEPKKMVRCPVKNCKQGSVRRKSPPAFRKAQNNLPGGRLRQNLKHILILPKSVSQQLQ